MSNDWLTESEQNAIPICTHYKCANMLHYLRTTPMLVNVFSMLLDLFHICLLHIFLASNINLTRIVSKFDKFITFDLEKEKNDDGYMKSCMFMPFAGIAKYLTAIYFHSKIGTMLDVKMIIFSQNRDEKKHNNSWSAWTNYSHSCNSGKYNRSRYNSLNTCERRFFSLLFHNHNHKHMCMYLLACVP